MMVDCRSEQRNIKARKQHVCSWCDVGIEPGELYDRSSYVEYREWTTCKTCKSCAKLWAWYWALPDTHDYGDGHPFEYVLIAAEETLTGLDPATTDADEVNMLWDWFERNGTDEVGGYDYFAKMDRTTTRKKCLELVDRSNTSKGKI